MELTYAIGDVHGMHAMVLKALDAIVSDAAGRPRKVVFTGDYVDRGPSSRDVIDLLRRGPSDPSETWVALRGNHDQMMIDSMRGHVQSRCVWTAHGGLATLRCYGDPALIDDVDPDEFEEHYKLLKALPHWRDADLLRDAVYFSKLPMWHDDGLRFFVHAGLRPGVAMEDQDVDDMLWIRDDFLDCDHEFGRLVVHGHTIRQTPEVKANRVSIDTGAYARLGHLTVAVFEEAAAPTRFIRVSHPDAEGVMDVHVDDASRFALPRPVEGAALGRLAAWRDKARIVTA